MRRPLAVLLLVPLSLSSSIAFAAPANGPTAIAVAGLLGGNTLVPIAQFRSGRWESTWPKPDEQVESKLSKLEELPKAWFPLPGGLPREWFLWADEVYGAPVQVGAPVLAGAHCQGVWALSTRLQPFGHETTAIATNVQTGIHSFGASVLGAFSDAGLKSLLRGTFEKAEAQALRSKHTGSSTAPRAGSGPDPIYKLRCAQTGAGDDEICSFEATRPVGSARSGPGSPCDEVVVVQGWLAKHDSGYSLLQANGVFTDCDAMDLRTSLPLGLLTIASRTFLLVREHGYEDESFVVFEVREGRLKKALEVPGGGC